MSEFCAWQSVKLKDDVAREFEATIGTWDNEFTGLVGLVGQLLEPKFADMNDWIFVAAGKRFGVSESEIEVVTP